LKLKLKLKLKYILLFILLLQFTVTYAQQNLVFSPINSVYGPSENRIRCLDQLKDGRIVIITGGLVNLYDGAYFHSLHYNEEKTYHLPEYNGFHHSYIDDDGDLWVKNTNKLMLFDIDKEQFVPEEGVKNIFTSHGIIDPVADFFIDAEYGFWYVTINQDFYYRKKGENNAKLFLSGTYKTFGENDQLYDIAVLESHVFMFYKSGLMICYDLNSGRENYRDNPFTGSRIGKYQNTLMLASHEQYIYQLRNGNGGIMLRYNIRNRKWENILETDYTLNTLTIDNSGNSWVSCPKGIWFIDRYLLTQKFYSELELVNGKTYKTEISTQYNDDNGGLWIGTFNRGLLYYHPDRFKFRNFGRSFFNFSNEEQELNVKGFAEYDGKILVGTNEGLFVYTSNSPKFDYYAGLPKNIICRALFKDTEKRIWLCADNHGLYQIDKKLKHFNFPQRILNIYESFSGQLYLCTNEGFGLFDPETGKYTPNENSKLAGLNSVFQLVDYRNDSLLGISNAGIFVFNIQNKEVSVPEKKSHEKSKMFYHSNHIYNSLYTDSRGLLWFGTEDGLNVWDANTDSLRCFYVNDGLVNNTVKSITEDRLGRLWISTSSGISRIQVSKQDEHFQYVFVNFNRFDGIIENEFVSQSVYETSNGKLLWGGLDGFNEIDLNHTDSIIKPGFPPLIIKFFIAGTEVQINKKYGKEVLLNQSISSTKCLNLNYNQNFLSFEFSALNYVNPMRTYFRYKMDGIDETWKEITSINGVGSAVYSSLPPGIYTFVVNATNDKSNWKDEFTRLTINIQPPFWKTRIAYIFYILLVLFIVYTIVFYYIKLHRKNVIRQQKEELEQLKYSFFTNISHELRTPLTLIITPLGSILKKIEDIRLKEQLNSIYRNANELLELVNQLLDFRKLEMKGETLHLSYCNINQLLESELSAFKELTDSKNIKFNGEFYLSDFYAYIDKNKFHRIISNLLSNAYKYTPNGGTITLVLNSCTLPETSIPCLKIEVDDTGCGIPEKELPTIFARFHQIKNNVNQYSGSGIGLHMVKEYIQLHNGKIAVESKEGVGSKFIVYIPLDLKPHEKDEAVQNESIEANSVKILIVEDNDEFRTFLAKELSLIYQVYEARNGVEGYEKAMELAPDLVISDLMMPGISGSVLCGKIKSNVNISHIPVIILTAKSTEMAQIESFKTKADAFIAKPFNMEVLLLRIKNLIEQQEQRKELFKKAIVLKPSSLTSTNIDEEFIKKALDFMEKNMSNTEYSVEQLSMDMCMDRTGLYRKLTAIVGQTPSGFIRSVRLKRSTQLLEQGMPVAEVADNVGFSTTSYFSRCFQDEFGVKPSHYAGK